MFADDIALYKEIISPSDQGLLQADLSNVSEWSRKWQLNLNPSKCETICISNKRAPPSASYRLDNQFLSTKSVVRYLGVFKLSIPTLSGQIMLSISPQKQLDP